jgi:CubicO group peptidase (beta-lactamase class C family)
VFRDGAIAYARGYGMASLEHDAPITPATVFYAGSVSKQFTAMSAALAMQQGKLSYDDSIRKYLPELPPYADAIKVSHLLHHTSGLRDYNTLLSIAGRRDEDAWDNRVVLQMTARQTQLNFTPGDEYLYSNTGYTLLATIVERATGTRFATFADANIFKPLGMTVTHYHVDAKRLVPGRALAYEGRAGEWTLDTPVNEWAGAGGLYTNIPDLQKWDENFYTGRVGGQDLTAHP